MSHQQNTSIPVGGASVLPQNLHLGFEVEVAGYMSKMMNKSEVCCDECVDRWTQWPCSGVLLYVSRVPVQGLS